MQTVSGKVLRGMGYGRALGFPTVNLDRREYARRKLRWKIGIYSGVASFVKDRGLKIKDTYHAAIVIGPNGKNDLPRIEAHLIGFTGNLYGKKVTLALHRYLRPFRKFRTEAVLKKAIAADVRRIKKLSKK